MFVCLECGNLFEEPIEWKEDRGECFGFPAYEELSGCPYCKGSYVETYRCGCCGEWINTNTYVQIGDERYCEDCFEVKDLTDE